MVCTSTTFRVRVNSRGAHGIQNVPNHSWLLSAWRAFPKWILVNAGSPQKRRQTRNQEDQGEGIQPRDRGCGYLTFSSLSPFPLGNDLFFKKEGRRVGCDRRELRDLTRWSRGLGCGETGSNGPPQVQSPRTAPWTRRIILIGPQLHQHFSNSWTRE